MPKLSVSNYLAKHGVVAINPVTMHFGVGHLKKYLPITIILTKSKQDSNDQTNSSFAGTKMHRYGVYG